MADEVIETPVEETPPAAEPVRVACIEGGVVVNVVMALLADLTDDQVASDEANVGDLWDGETFTAAEPPAAPRRLIAKSVVIRRLHEAGKLADALALLDQPENLYARERWRTPDWPNVYFDDPDLILVLQAVGADVEAITAPDLP